MILLLSRRFNLRRKIHGGVVMLQMHLWLHQVWLLHGHTWLLHLHTWLHHGHSHGWLLLRVGSHLHLRGRAGISSVIRCGGRLSPVRRRDSIEVIVVVDKGLFVVCVVCGSFNCLAHLTTEETAATKADQAENTSANDGDKRGDIALGFCTAQVLIVTLSDGTSKFAI